MNIVIELCDKFAKAFNVRSWHGRDMSKIYVNRMGYTFTHNMDEAHVRAALVSIKQSNKLWVVKPIVPVKAAAPVVEQTVTQKAAATRAANKKAAQAEIAAKKKAAVPAKQVAAPAEELADADDVPF